MRLGRYKIYKQGELPYEDVYNPNRYQHTYVLGKSGTGKSTAIERWIIDDITNGDGVLFIDPHGQSTETILQHIPPHRVRDTILFDPLFYPLPFNVLADKTDKDRTTSAVVETLRNQWKDNWGPYPDLFVQLGVMALLEIPDASLLDLQKLLLDEDYRKRIARKVTDPLVKDYWSKTFPKMSKKDQAERPMSTVNKLIPLIADSRTREILGNPRTSFTAREVRDKGQILLAHLNHGHLGIQKASLLTNILLSQFHNAGLQGARPFHIYIDECHHVGPFLAEMLTGLRKFNVSLTLANQYLDQFTPEMRSSVLGTVGTVVAFRCRQEDGELLFSEFRQAPKHQANVRTPDDEYVLVMDQTTAPYYPHSPRKIRNYTRHSR